MNHSTSRETESDPHREATEPAQFNDMQLVLLAVFAAAVVISTLAANRSGSDTGFGVVVIGSLISGAIVDRRLLWAPPLLAIISVSIYEPRCDPATGACESENLQLIAVVLASVVAMGLGVAAKKLLTGAIRFAKHRARGNDNGSGASSGDTRDSTPN